MQHICKSWAGQHDHKPTKQHSVSTVQLWGEESEERRCNLFEGQSEGHEAESEMEAAHGRRLDRVDLSTGLL
jgi:hypothetical protein